MRHIDDDWLLTLEQDLRHGRLGKVRRSLHEVNARKLPRPQRLPVAHMARRAGLLNLALRLLRPVVRPARKTGGVATHAELAGYAITLHKLGANEEAMEILTSIDGLELPVVWLYRAFVRFSNWDYSAAIPDLEAYVRAPSLSRYERLVGLLNLAAAYVNEVDAKAEAVLSELLVETKKSGFEGMYGSALELAAQLNYWRGEYELAEAKLSESHSLTHAQTEQQSIWVRKWSCLITLARDGVSAGGLARLDQIRGQAMACGDSETWRECDLHLALLTRDESLFRRVYTSSPQPAYRARMLRLFANPPAIPETSIWPAENAAGFDFEKGCDLQGRAELNAGQSTHRLLWALSLDLYRRASVGSLFHHLFPGEHFNPDTSCDRVQAIVYRARAWLKQHELPMDIRMHRDENHGYYMLHAQAGYGLLINRDRALKPPHPKEALLARIESRWKTEEFAAHEVSVELELSLGTVITALNWGIEQRRLVRQKKWRKTRYQFGRAA